MKIARKQVSEAARSLVFDTGQYDSKLPDEDALLNAARAPYAASLTDNPSDPLIARMLQRNAVALAQTTHIASVNTGLANFAAFATKKQTRALLRLVGQAAFEADSNIRQLAEGVMSVIDVVVEGPLSAVPFVGPAARTLWGIAQMVYDYSTREAPLPPMFRMDPRGDNVDTGRALTLLKAQGSDWTPIFLPRGRGLWQMNVREGGIQFERESYEGEDAKRLRLGCAPGDAFYVDAGVQSRITTAHVTIPSTARKPKRSLVIPTGENPVSLHQRVFGLSQWYPSLSAVGRAVWSLLGRADSTAMFQVDAQELLAEWVGFNNACAAFRSLMDPYLGARIEKYSKVYKREVIAAYLGNLGAALHDLRDPQTGQPYSQEQLVAVALDPSKRSLMWTVGRQAIEHSSHLMVRQREAIETPLNALVSEDAPAFRSRKTLGEDLLRERAQMLAAGVFDDLDASEIPDRSLRKDLAARLAERRPKSGAGAPTSFADPVSTERQQAALRERRALVGKISPPLGMNGFGADPQEEQEKNGGVGVVIAALAGLGLLGGVGWGLYRQRGGRAA